MVCVSTCRQEGGVKETESFHSCLLPGAPGHSDQQSCHTSREYIPSSPGSASLLLSLMLCVYVFQRNQKISDLSVLFINMHHLINEFRPHQVGQCPPAKTSVTNCSRCCCPTGQRDAAGHHGEAEKTSGRHDSTSAEVSPQPTRLSLLNQQLV